MAGGQQTSRLTKKRGEGDRAVLVHDDVLTCIGWPYRSDLAEAVDPEIARNQNHDDDYADDGKDVHL
jgi:hypothetical protein